MAAKSEATNNKVDSTNNKISNTNNKVDALMAMLQQQNMNMMNQTILYKSPMGQMTSNQHMAVTPNSLSFQQAQQQITQDPQTMGTMMMFHPGMSNQLMGGSSGGQNSVMATPEMSNYAGGAATLQAQ
eukprot:6291576-Ditylum_brightwellii.AAC.1